MENAGEKAGMGRVALYDAACKRLLSQKVILAQIMKGLLREYGDCTTEEIARECIEGSPCIDGTLGMSDGVPQLVTGVDVRNVLAVPGKVDFDVLFYARPSPRAAGSCRDMGWPGLTGLVINIEAQHDFYPGYPLLKRAQYYCAQSACEPIWHAVREVALRAPVKGLLDLAVHQSATALKGSRRVVRDQRAHVSGRLVGMGSQRI